VVVEGVVVVVGVGAVVVDEGAVVVVVVGGVDGDTAIVVVSGRVVLEAVSSTAVVHATNARHAPPTASLHPYRPMPITISLSRQFALRAYALAGGTDPCLLRLVSRSCDEPSS
jgi:hypothetical protein